MKQPKDCSSIEEIREAIDMLDQNIIKLLGERYQYVKEIVKFKEKTRDAIVAKERYNAVIESRKKLAKKHGLNPDVIGEVYKTLIQHFIQEEMDLIKD